MKQMEYGKNIKDVEVLYHGSIDNFECVIINNGGTHPCAYINVPKDILNKYDDPKLVDEAWSGDCHGGFTYSEPTCPGLTSENEGFWLGWDYAHAGDYICMMVGGNIIRLPKEWEKTWKTCEILENVIDTIHSLKYDTDYYFR